MSEYRQGENNHGYRQFGHQGITGSTKVQVSVGLVLSGASPDSKGGHGPKSN